jgi:ribosomal protein S18 acetylase RimI-like enzyme
MAPETLASMTPESLTREWLEHPPSHNGRMTVAEQEPGGKVIGFLFTGVSDTDGALGIVYALHVHPSAHGAGAGRRLLEHGQELLAAQGADTLELYVLDGNERAMRFYRRNGWEHDGVRFADDGGHDYLRFVRPAPWDPGAPGVLRLPSGALVRGRPLSRPVPPGPQPDFGLYLLGHEPPRTTWDSTWVPWRDFWLPADQSAFAAALDDAHARCAVERVEVACAGGKGRTGTALACLAILDGCPPREAVAFVRRGYSRHAVETPWQRRFVRTFTRSL